MLFFVNATEAEKLDTDNKRLPITYYNDIINKELNPFEFYVTDAIELNSVVNSDAVNPYTILLIKFSVLLDETKQDVIFDIDGTPFDVYSLISGLYLPSAGGTSTDWSDVGDLKIITFSSTYDFYYLWFLLMMMTNCIMKFLYYQLI